MPDTLQASVVILVGLLPGALYTWSFERVVGDWGIGLSDRLLRFVGVSSILQVVMAPATLWVWRTFITTGRLRDGSGCDPTVGSGSG